MSSRSATTLAVGTSAVVAGVLSVVRLLLANADALSTLVWAEDGLFPLCARVHGPWACLVEPYSGYLLLVPRLVAWPVGAVGIDAWPAATTIAAAVLAAGLAALTALVLRANGSGVVAAAVVAVLPTLAPIMGFEAIAVTASVYMPLLVLAALAVCFPPAGRFPTWAYAAGGLAVALTIPSSAVLLVALLVQALRRRIPRRAAAVVAGTTVLGLALQLWASVTAANPRPMDWSVDAARAWVDGLPVAFLTVVPDQVTIGPTGAFAAAALPEPGTIGVIAVLVLLALGLVLAALPGATSSGVGMLVLLGLVLGILPAAAGYANNRYFVLPVLLVTAALVITVDRVMPVRRELASGVLAGAIVLVSIPGLPASPTRTTAVPEWGPMLATVREACSADPAGEVALTFTPSWPFADAVFPGPTGNVVPCTAVLP